jgi:KR domain
VNQSIASLRNVFAPKVAGWSALASACGTLPQSYAVLFSSITAFLGAGGQANYAAANEELNQRAQLQQLAGLNSISIMWGLWAAGMAAKDAALISRLELSGMLAIGPDEGLSTLGWLVAARHPIVPQVIAAPIIWERLLKRGSRAARSMVFSDFLAEGSRAGIVVVPTMRSNVAETSAAKHKVWTLDRPMYGRAVLMMSHHCQLLLSFCLLHVP